MSSDSNTAFQQRIVSLFDVSQRTLSSHERCCQLLKKIYDEMKEDQFMEIFQTCLHSILKCDYKLTGFVDKTIDFVTLFVGTTMASPEKVPQINGVTERDDDEESILESEFQVRIFDFLLEMQCNSDQNVRFRSCQLMCGLFHRMIGSSLSLDICEKIQSALLERFEDPLILIRIQAAKTLFSLQDPENGGDEIIDVYLSHLCDKSYRIRKICVENIALTKSVLEAFVCQLRDIHPEVRLATYERIQKIPKFFKIFQRQRIAWLASIEKSPRVIQHIRSSFIMSWLERYDGLYIKLLSTFRLDSSWEDLDNTLKSFKFVIPILMENRPIQELIDALNLTNGRILRAEDVTCDYILLWRCLVDNVHAKSQKDDKYDELFDLLVPELIYFCRFIEEFSNTLPVLRSENIEMDEKYIQNQFILTQLLHMTTKYEYVDNVNRRVLNELVFKLLKETTMCQETVKQAMRCLELSIPDVESRIEKVCELISEIKEPLIEPETPVNSQASIRNPNLHFQTSQLKVKIHEIKDLQENYVKDKNFDKAKELQVELDKCVTELDELNRLIVSQNDVEAISLTADILASSELMNPLVVLQYLSIAMGLMDCPFIGKLTPHLTSLFENVILDTKLADPEVQILVFRAIGVFCVKSRDLAGQRIHMFCEPINRFGEQQSINFDLLNNSMKIVHDLIMVHGTGLIAEPSSVSTDHNTSKDRVLAAGTSLMMVVNGLVRIMQSTNDELQLTSVIVLCNLICNGRIHSADVLHKLIIRWCLPVTELMDEKVKAYIGKTFQEMVNCTDSADILQNAILPVIKTIVGAPKHTPLADVNISDVIRCLLDICMLCDQGAEIHSNLAFTICRYLRSHPSGNCNIIYSRMLLEINISNKQTARELMCICDDLKEEIENRTLMNNIIKFYTKLDDFIANNVSIIVENDNEDALDEEE